MLKEWLMRLRFLIGSKPYHEIDEEIQFHLAQQTRANVAAGITQEEARRQAAIAFGGVDGVRERSHEERPGYLIETILQDVR
jgi:putative ABC transport system permease protein